MTQSSTLANIFPILKVTHLVDKNSPTSTINLDSEKEPDRPFMTEDIDGLITLYGVAKGDSITFLKNGLVESLSATNISKKDFINLALSNLHELSQEHTKFIGKIEDGMRITTIDWFESSTMLLFQFWNNLQKTTKGKIVVAIPRPNYLLVTNDESQNGIEKLRQTIRDEKANEKIKNSTVERLYIWDNSKWSVYETVKQTAPNRI